MLEASGTLLGLSAGSLGALLGLSWALLGPSWGPQGPLLGLSWGHLGPSWSHLEASRAHRKRKGEKAKNICFFKVFEGFWPLGGLLGRLLGLLKPS